MIDQHADADAGERGGNADRGSPSSIAELTGKRLLKLHRPERQIMRNKVILIVGLALGFSLIAAQAKDYHGVVCRTLPTWQECYACGAKKYGAAAQGKHCAGLPGTPAKYR